MAEKKTNKKRVRTSQRSKGQRHSSMKTSGVSGGFIPSMRNIKTGWSAAERKDLFHFMFEYVRHHEQDSATQAG